MAEKLLIIAAMLISAFCEILDMALKMLYDWRRRLRGAG